MHAGESSATGTVATLDARRYNSAMQAVRYERFGEPAEVLTVADVPDLTPGSGEVRVRMLAAPVNPSDLMTVRDQYGRRQQLPATPGYEGVGVVEAGGGGLLAKFMTGKRVAVGHRAGGTWAEQCVVPAKQVIPLPKDVDDDQGAMFFVNPITAYVMTRRVLQVPAGDWLLQTAAGSALGRMVIRLGQQAGFRTLNIVRRADQVDELKALGADAAIAFNPANDDAVKLRSKIAQHVGEAGLRYAIDPVGGPTGSAVVCSLGKRGRMLVYGTLSDQPLSFSSRALMTPGASVEGFWLTNYLDGLNLLGKLRLIKKVGKLVAAGVLASQVGESFPLNDIARAVAASEQSGRAGKVLVRLSSS